MSLYREGHELFLTAQNVAEFWNVCTRPTDVNGLGLSIEAAESYTNQLDRFFLILPESAKVFEEWRRIVVRRSVRGVKVHDARLVAAMRVHSVENILTFNVQDFVRFDLVDPIHPDKF